MIVVVAAAGLCVADEFGVKSVYNYNIACASISRCNMRTASALPWTFTALRGIPGHPAACQ